MNDLIVPAVATISNSTFLHTIYGELPPGQHGWVCNFRSDPSDTPPSVWNGRLYKGMPAQTAMIDRVSDDNTYFSVSVLKATDVGQVVRQKDAFVRLAALVADDVVLDEFLGHPTWVLETSPGKHQVGIKISATDPDAEDRELVDRVMKQLGEHAGIDRHGNNCVRYARLAVGTNTKPAAGGFKHRLVEWNPAQELTLDEAASMLGIDLDRLRTAPQPAPGNYKPDPLLRSLDGVGEGSRNDTVFRYASGFRAGRLPTEDEVKALVLLKASNCAPPLPEDEALKCMKSAYSYPEGKSEAFRKPHIDAETGEIDEGPPVEGPPLQPISLQGVGQGQEPATEHKIEHLLPERVVTLLAAHGGTGKSLLALSMAVALATGQPFAELACKRSRVLLLSCEDDDLVLRYRLDRVLQAGGMTHHDLGDQLVVYDMTDRDSVLFAGGREGGQLTPQYEWLRQRIEQHNADVVVIDNASDVFDGNEINRAQVRQFVRSLARLVRDRNGAVLLLAHVDKSTARGSAAGSESYSGSTAWHNSVRSRLFMAEEDGHIVLRHEKANYGPRAPDVHLVRSGPMLRPVSEQGADPAAGLKRDIELAAVLRLMVDFEQRGERISTAPNQPNNPYRLMSSEKGFPRSITKSGMNSVMRELERRRYITKREERTDNRKVRERWTMTSDGLQWLESGGAPVRHACATLNEAHMAQARHACA